jgi:outer membrane biosynthesis protein TonB
MQLIHVTLAPLLLAAGCAAIAPDPPVVSPPEAVPTQPATQQHAAKPSTETTPPAPAESPSPVAPTVAPQAENRAPAPGTKAGTRTPSAETKPPAVPAPASTTAKPAPSPAAAVSASVAPTLDLAALKEQLKETKAIGVFTKITLKNQVDDLLQQFRDHYQGKAKITMAQLRRSYELLLMKVLSLLQDADQKLAAAIVSSREAIWALLADPKKFATLEG